MYSQSFINLVSRNMRILSSDHKQLKSLICTLVFLLLAFVSYSQGTYCLKLELEIGSEVGGDFEKNGRLYLFLSKNTSVEPRMQTWPSPYGGNTIFAKNIKDYDIAEAYLLESDDSWTSTASWSLNSVPEGEFYVQFL